MTAEDDRVSKSTVYYWDSSALIKRYFQENGSEQVSALFADHGAIHCTSVISHAEILATLHRIRRDGRLSKADLHKTQHSFLSDWARLSVFPYSPQAQHRATQLIDEVSLRGADLIHLATAEEVASLLAKPTLVTFDLQLVTAARDRKIAVCGV